MVRTLAISIVAGILSVTQGFQSVAHNHALFRPTSPLSQVKTQQSMTSSSRLFVSPSSSGDEKLTVPSLPNWDPTNWTPKKFWNKPLFRAGAILAVLALAGFGSPLSKISATAAATVHLLSFSAWFGSVIFTTFIGGITMYKNLPRQTFGRLQSKLFPKYFNLCAITILLQILTLSKIPDVLSKRAEVALGTAFVTTLLNLFVLEPKSTKVMFERYDLENMPGGKDSENYKELASTFGKLHGMSSLSNLVALCAAVAHGFYIASALIM